MKPDFAQQLIAYRESMNLTQKKFSEKYGIGFSTLCKWEQYINEVNLTTLVDKGIGEFIFKEQK